MERIVKTPIITVPDYVAVCGDKEWMNQRPHIDIIKVIGPGGLCHKVIVGGVYMRKKI